MNADSYPNPSINMKQKHRYLLLACYLALFIYVACRAYFLSFTYDESLSYLIFNGEPHIKGLANHHWLNTWLMQLFSFCFGEHEFFLRLPNVMAFVFYVYHSDRILQRINSWPVSAITLPLLLLNPFILDFFSLARGYGLSLGMMAGALDHFLRFCSDDNSLRKTRSFSLSVLFSSLALLANLSLINFSISLMAIGALYWITNMRTIKLKLLPMVLIVGVGFGVIALGADRLLFLKSRNELYFGTEDFNYTLNSLIERSFYFSPYPPWFFDVLQKTLFILFPFGIVLVLLRKKWSSSFTVVTAILLLLLCGLYIEHRLFEALYPVSRAALYFLPLSAFFVGLMMHALFSLMPGSNKLFQIVPGLLISGLMIFHLSGKIGLSYCFEWQYDANTKDASEQISRLERSSEKLKVGATWLFVPSLKYYSISRKLHLDIVHWYCDPPLDAIYTINDNAPGEGWIKLKGYPDTGSALFVPVRPGD